jgi:hypothetical protein
MIYTQQEKAKAKLGEISIDIFELINEIEAYELHVHDRVIVDKLKKALGIVEAVERSLGTKKTKGRS